MSWFTYTVYLILKAGVGDLLRSIPVHPPPPPLTPVGFHYKISTATFWLLSFSCKFDATEILPLNYNCLSAYLNSNLLMVTWNPNTQNFDPLSWSLSWCCSIWQQFWFPTIWQHFRWSSTRCCWSSLAWWRRAEGRWQGCHHGPLHNQDLEGKVLWVKYSGNLHTVGSESRTCM